METPKLTIDGLPQAVHLLLEEIRDLKRLLLKQGHESQSETDKFLTIKQTAEYLNLSVNTIYGYVHRCTIPVNKRPGTKRLYFSKDELKKWVSEGRKKTVSEVEAEADLYINNKKKFF